MTCPCLTGYHLLQIYRSVRQTISAQASWLVSYDSRLSDGFGPLWLEVLSSQQFFQQASSMIGEGYSPVHGSYRSHYCSEVQLVLSQIRNGRSGPAWSMQHGCLCPMQYDINALILQIYEPNWAFRVFRAIKRPV